MAGAGLNVARQLGHRARLTLDTYGHVVDETDHAPCGGRRDPAGSQQHVLPVSGRDRIVGVMSASGSHDSLPSNCGCGATMGPSGCSAQSSPVVFRARCCACLLGLRSSWDDWRGQRVFLIRKRSLVRVLDRPLAGIQEFAAFAQCSGFRAASGSDGLGAPRGHMGPPAGCL
jgi:hypothetical protein